MDIAITRNLISCNKSYYPFAPSICLLKSRVCLCGYLPLAHGALRWSPARDRMLWLAGDTNSMVILSSLGHFTVNKIMYVGPPQFTYKNTKLVYSYTERCPFGSLFGIYPLLGGIPTQTNKLHNFY